MLTDGREERVLDTDCLALANVDMSDSVRCSGRFIDLVLVSCSPGDESRDVFLVRTSMICLVDCSYKIYSEMYMGMTSLFLGVKYF